MFEVVEGDAMVAVSSNRAGRSNNLGEFKVQAGDVLCLEPTSANHFISKSTDPLLVTVQQTS